jgi:outer membrane protein OmpA-like peptidoglycan-associated protein
MLSEDPDVDRARDDVRGLAHALFDGRRAARSALGTVWDQRTGPEREEFSRVFQAKDSRDVRIDYLMTRPDWEWRVHDIVIDGVSLVENCPAQFARVLDSRPDGRGALAGDVLRDHVDGRRPIPGQLGPNHVDVGTLTMAGAGEPITASPRDGARPGDVVVYFDTGRAELGPAGRRDLEAAAAWLVANEQARGLVEGHSDQQGDSQLNQTLAEHRAHAIRAHLVSRGVDADRLVVVPYGSQRPMCHEPVDACWAQNRRAVVRLTPSMGPEKTSGPRVPSW